MKLFYTRGACSLVVRIILNEMNLPFEQESVDLRTKKTESGADYLAINPKGAVPAVLLDNGVVLSENQVILQYIVDNAGDYNLLAKVGNFARYQTLEWLNYISTEVHKTLGSCFNQAIPEELKKTVLLPLAMQRFGFINAHLANHSYLSGQEFTLPDAYLFVMVRWAHFFKMDLTPLSHLNAYIKKLEQRPSIALSLQQEGL